MTSLAYLRNEIKFNASDWQSLTTEEKDLLKAWAADEMAALGLTVDRPAAA